MGQENSKLTSPVGSLYIEINNITVESGGTLHG